MQTERIKRWAIIISIVALLAVIFSLPAVQSRVVYHSQRAYRVVKYWLKPPSEAVFLPSTELDLTATPESTLLPATPTVPQSMAESTSIPSQTAAPAIASSPAPTLIPTLTSAPLPSDILLTGFHCERQFMNNCGPATLSMNLSYYDWGKNQLTTSAVIRPNIADVNVMPYELANYVNEHTDLRALWRYGGDLQTIKALLNLGVPVIIEKGFEPFTLQGDGWMGHYNLVAGYDDEKEIFTMHDTYLMSYAPWGGQIPEELYDTFIGFDFSYSETEKSWQAFNYVFVVAYPPEKENDVLAALGPLATAEEAAQIAYDRAMQETTSLTDKRDKYFAWYNAGTSLVVLQDYPAAAAAYDEAFGIYPDILENKRPYRMLWYQTGPYEAYYHAARYQDVINLANLTLGNMADPALEESYYWRARSYLALGDELRAENNLRSSLKYHPGYIPSLTLLQEMGITP